MALTESNAFQKGTKAANFSLLNVVNDSIETLENLKGEKGTVILFICNHCPYVIHINKTLIALANKNQKSGINFIAISSNNVEKYPLDSPELMKKQALELGYPFPYLYDESQEVAKAYDATCTPDIFLYDADLSEVYHGRLDASRPGNELPSTGEELQKAIDNLIAGQAPLSKQLPSMGCGIKWK
jgi:thiol-disulfide isomerase/thioredoxin